MVYNYFFLSIRLLSLLWQRWLASTRVRVDLQVLRNSTILAGEIQYQSISFYFI